MAMDLGLQKEISPVTENFPDFRWPCVLGPLSHWRQGGYWLVCQRQRKHGKQWELSQGRLSGQILSRAEFLVRSTIFCIPLSPHPSQVLMSFSAPYSPTLLAHVSPSMWMNKFRIHKKRQGTAWFIVAVNCNEKWPVELCRYWQWWRRYWEWWSLGPAAISRSPITVFSSCQLNCRLCVLCS